MAGFFQTVRSAFSTSGLDMAPYTVLRTAEGYEERLYPAQKWVKTQMNNMSKDKASSAMFWKLFQYISGSNSNETKIPMTSPVTTLIEPGAGPNCESTFTMAFYLSPSFQEDTPQPTESTVTIEERPEFKVLARTYGGFSNDQKLAQEYDNLSTSLTEDDRKLVDPVDSYYGVGYDPPFKLFSRRNEVWFVIRDSNQPVITKPVTPCATDDVEPPA